MSEKQKRPGRWQAGDGPSSGLIRFRVSPEQRRILETIAKGAGTSMSDWIRSAALAAAKRCNELHDHIMGADYDAGKTS